jgi:FkbM family methyltransferase
VSQLSKDPQWSTRTPEAWEKLQRVLDSESSPIPLEWVQRVAAGAQLKHVLERLEIDCVLDIGANEGQFGTTLRQLGYEGWIVSFEPVSEVFQKLRATADNDERWRVFPYALGATNERKAINVVELSLMSSFLQPREDSLERFPFNRVERIEPVEIRRLDDVAERCFDGIESPRIYLKIDTQGFDLEVMRGGEETLRRVLAVQTEVSFQNVYEGMPSFLESIREFQARGFAVVGFAPVTSDVDEICAVEMDCILARPRVGEVAG